MWNIWNLLWRKINNSRRGTMKQPARACQADCLRKKGNIRPRWGFQRQELEIDRTMGKDAGPSVVVIPWAIGMNLKWTGKRRAFLRASPMKSPMAQIPPMKKGLLFFSNPLKSGGEWESNINNITCCNFKYKFHINQFDTPSNIPSNYWCSGTFSGGFGQSKNLQQILASSRTLQWLPTIPVITISAGIDGVGIISSSLRRSLIKFFTSTAVIPVIQALKSTQMPFNIQASLTKKLFISRFSELEVGCRICVIGEFTYCKLLF